MQYGPSALAVAEFEPAGFEQGLASDRLLASSTGKRGQRWVSDQLRATRRLATRFHPLPRDGRGRKFFQPRSQMAQRLDRQENSAHGHGQRGWIRPGKNHRY